jgi:general secretion pathway protein M
MKNPWGRGWAIFMQRWHHISTREQRLLIALGVFILVLLAYSQIWQPTRQRLTGLERDYQQQLLLALQLQQIPPNVNRTAHPDQPLSLRVSESTAAAGLEMHQMDVDNDVLRLTLSGEAKALLQWLDRVEGEGVALQSLILQKRDARLEAQVVLK